MAVRAIFRRPLGFAKPILQRKFVPGFERRCFTTAPQRKGILGLKIPDRRTGSYGEDQRIKVAELMNIPPREPMRKEPIRRRVYPAPPSARKICKEPINAIKDSQLAVLDPKGARARLFSPTNPEAAKVGDILLVRQKSGDPFAGVCINIRRRGIDSGILLRNQLTRVGVEMWYKIFSPNVEGIEVVQRRVKRARRARLYYMRQPKHDSGSVQNIVHQYTRQRQALRSGESRGRDASSHKKKSKKSK